MTASTEGEQGGGARDVIASGRAVLGIELGSTRIKACLIDPAGRVLGAGGADWENALVDGRWTYALEDVRSGLQAAYRDLAQAVRKRHGLAIDTLGGVGVSAMMHGHLALDADGGLLVPFRTWRNTSTGEAAAALTQAFGVNIPMRWSVAHLLQAVLDGEPHVRSIAALTTLAGWVHRGLTGRHVLGVGDASGMFPIDPATGGYDTALLARFDDLVADRAPGLSLADLLPEVLPAGRHAGRLSEDGARLLDPSGVLRPGAPVCPPEGDAGTGMVATGSVAPREGNVSVGTSVFAMVVLEGPLDRVHPEIDLVTTPTGDPVAMVHCNTGAAELAAWAGLFARFAEASGHAMARDEVFRVLLHEALEARAEAEVPLVYGVLSGEPVLDLVVGRPLVVRAAGAPLTLSGFMRAQVLGVFGTLAIGMRILDGEGVRLDRMLAHGGIFRTEGVAEQFLAGALDAPVLVGEEASEGGAWGMALLAAYASSGAEQELGEWLRQHALAGRRVRTTRPEPEDVAAFATWLERYRAGLPVVRTAAEHL